MMSREKTKKTISRGKRYLGIHKTHQALKVFREVSASLPPENGKELSESLYWMGICLLKLGKSDLALNAFSSSAKLHKNGIGRQMHKRFCNAYGMLKRESPCLDDFYAFFSIKTTQITALKKAGKFPATMDGDTLFRELVSVWKNITESNPLNQTSIQYKKTLFQSTELPFISKDAQYPSGQILPVHFRAGTILRQDSRCYCGSGLAYGSCCGRIPSPNTYCIG